MSIAASLAAQSAIYRANNAELEAIKASNAQQSLIGARGNLDSIARKEAMLDAKKEQAQIQAKIAHARKKALEGGKLNYFA